MTSSHRNIVTRFAPSPTGFMHVGNVRTALYSYLMARAHGGTFILRIEDTDKEREVAGAITHIIESLRWLGITWDEGPEVGGIHAPYIQSERLDIYVAYAQKLIDAGYAYPDPYTAEEVEILRQKSEAEKKPFLFREHRPETTEPWDKTKPLRFKVKTLKRYEWEDMVYGTLSAGEEALDDFILIKSDGYPTYNFAHIVDDIEMGVTHVMRGQEFIASTPKFLSVYEALGAEAPLFATLPHVMASDGKKKLGKRDGAKDILQYRTEGYLPETMVNFLAFLGWNPGDEREMLTKEDLVRDFDITRVGKSGAQFNDEKLNWLNREYLKKYSPDMQTDYIKSFIPHDFFPETEESIQMLQKITPIVMERISNGVDIAKMATEGELTYFFVRPSYEKDALFFASSKIPTENKYEILKGYLMEVHERLSALSHVDFTKETIKETLWPYAEEVGRGDILWPLRYLLSGRNKSPDPFILAETLGKEETCARILLAVQILSK